MRFLVWLRWILRFFPLFHCANSSRSQQNPEVDRAATVKYEKLPSTNTVELFAYGSSARKRGLGAGSLAGSGHLPGAESRLPDSSGGRHVLAPTGPTPHHSLYH